ncbi:hypothetical protein C8R45DRAFT_936110 [Mycena sanguinolenta]|nr:hypothetical protein C8R45DRAFT_936110 [Mycena sanguinolenta]
MSLAINLVSLVLDDRNVNNLRSFYLLVNKYRTEKLRVEILSDLRKRSSHNGINTYIFGCATGFRSTYDAHRTRAGVYPAQRDLRVTACEADAATFQSGNSGEMQQNGCRMRATNGVWLRERRRRPTNSKGLTLAVPAATAPEWRKRERGDEGRSGEATSMNDDQDSEASGAANSGEVLRRSAATPPIVEERAQLATDGKSSHRPHASASPTSKTEEQGPYACPASGVSRSGHRERVCWSVSLVSENITKRGQAVYPVCFANNSRGRRSVFVVTLRLCLRLHLHIPGLGLCDPCVPHSTASGTTHARERTRSKPDVKRNATAGWGEAARRVHDAMMGAG